MAALDVVGDGAGESPIPSMLVRAAETGRVVLAVWVDRAGGTLHGRFHPAAPGVQVRRRHTGGPAVVPRPRHVRVALALPHRSVIESDDPRALRPEQTMNRCVRGLLDACRVLGVDARYPGRDVVTAGGAPVGWLALTEGDDGAALFEAGLMADLVAPDVDAGDAATAVVGAYRRRPWSEVEEIGAVELPETPWPDLDWVVPEELERTGEVPAMLGTLRADLRLDERWRVAAARISGDVIAPVGTMRAIEAAITGVPALRSEIARAVERALGDERRWVLGIDGPRDVAAAVMAAVG